MGLYRELGKNVKQISIWHILCMVCRTEIDLQYRPHRAVVTFNQAVVGYVHEDCVRT